MADPESERVLGENFRTDKGVRKDLVLVKDRRALEPGIIAGRPAGQLVLERRPYHQLIDQSLAGADKPVRKQKNGSVDEAGFERFGRGAAKPGDGFGHSAREVRSEMPAAPHG